jgi:hypothetical protein
MESEMDLPPKTEMRTYSPIPRSRLLADDDDDDMYVERMAEIANDMDNCHGFMDDLGAHVKNGEDL